MSTNAEGSATSHEGKVTRTEAQLQVSPCYICVDDFYTSCVDRLDVVAWNLCVDNRWYGGDDNGMLFGIPQPEGASVLET